MINAPQIIELGDGFTAIATELTTSSSNLFETNDPTPKEVIENKPKMVPWGDNNDLPWAILGKLGKSVVMSPNTLFSVLAGYGQGIEVKQLVNGKETDLEEFGEIDSFFQDNLIDQYYLEQLNDMKPFFFTITEFILSVDQKKITDINHLEDVFCRFSSMNKETGRIECIYYANWKDNPDKDSITQIPLLDHKRPFKDLQEKIAKDKKLTKVAMVNRFPLPGNTYYPVPPYASAFESQWYDIAQLIPIGKKAKFQNGIRVRYHIENHKDYFPSIYKEERITDPEKQQKRKKEEYENIKNFLSGMENSGKAWFSTFYTDPTGKEVQMVRITNLDKASEGGDWIADSEEASNMLCYAQGVHPNLNGATPGKSGSNMSGSDKRELFTIKQALEKPFRDILLRPIKLAARFNGYKNLIIRVPDLMLTTLDKGKDAEKTTSPIETK